MDGAFTSQRVRLRGMVGALAVLFAVALGCSGTDDDGGPLNGGSANTGGGDSSGGGSGGTGGGAPTDGSCEPCNGTCVDLSSDSEHCGTCSNACESYEACLAGECVRVTCDEPLTLCDGDCADTDADVFNCGSCGVECGLTYTCGGGECGCPSDRLECTDYCAHPLFDRAHCGDCNAPCAADQACVEGECETIDIPGLSYCEDTIDWPQDLTALEFEILDIVNRRRAEGASCGARGYFPPVPPLQMDASLRCSARMHSQDMVDRNYFSHDTLGSPGRGPDERMEDAGYSGRGWGENIAAGRGTAAGTMEQWMNSDGHCANVMSGNFSLIGVGYAPREQGSNAEYGHYWTQNFGN